MVWLVAVAVLLWVVCFFEVLISKLRMLLWVVVLLLAVTVVMAVTVLYVSMCLLLLFASLCLLVSVLFVVICSPLHLLHGPMIPLWSLDLPICLVLCAMPCLAEVVVLL